MPFVPNLSQLKVVDLREAWAHEAHHFTPWLAQNIDQLSEVVGIPLEIEGTEVSVESFSADILARNTMDDSIVLVENQLEGSDHTHLGQIMTYLAGLDAHTIIWIAKEFREPHLAALRWLNDHTDERFAFFAVKIKVAQIADSPLAPIFDVVERPNNWERAVHAKSAQRVGGSVLTKNRHAFWSAYVDRVVGERERSGEAGRSSNRWRVLEDLGFILSIYVAKGGVGIFIRGLQRAHGADVKEALIPHESDLAKQLGVAIGGGADHFFHAWEEGDYTDESQRDRLIDWLAEKADLYERILRDAYGDL